MSVDYLPACSLSRRSLLLLAVCRRPSPLQAPVDSWSTRLLLQLLLLPASTALHCTATATACPSASLPALPGFVGSLLPRQRTHSLTTAFRPALPHPVSQSSHSQSHHDCLSVCLLRDQAATSATTSPESPARAGPDISYLLSPHLLLARSPPPVISSNLAASATVSAPSPCDAAANNNNATASDQPFACGRPIHLATSSPNKRADFRSSLA